MSGFSLDWLSLREPADLSARDNDLLQDALRWLQDRDTPIIVDLGAGSGATLRALERTGLRDGLWRLVDNDGALLDAALRRHLAGWMLEDHQSDLTIVGELPLGGARLVTASALFDLASESFLDQLVARLPSGCALYSALNYDGDMHWGPAHALDAEVVAAFNRDQRRDKGMGGQALGPQAVAYLTQLLEERGFRVQVAASPWRLSSEDSTLMEALVTGIAAAVADQFPAQALADWQHCQEQADSCYVGHLDLLALPVDVTL